MKRMHTALVLILIIIFTGLGWFAGQKSSQTAISGATTMPGTPTTNGVVQDGSGKTVKYWYDPMVPEQKFDKPGKSPFMDMQLEPKYANTENAHGTEEGGVEISAQTTQNLGIRIEKVVARNFGESLAAIGRIAPDERRFYAVQTRMPGFVERLLVRAVGDPVVKGQKVAEIYAPEILAAQQEYLALQTLSNIDSDGALQLAARNRLKLLGMSESEVMAITKTGKANPRFGVYAPASGVLTELGVREGGQLMSGNSLMQISDLSRVWLIAEIPERDAARLKPGLAAEIQLQSLPDETFKGKVDYLYPILNDASRTLQLRIELPNKANRLRPGMYANVSLTGQPHEALSVPTESIIATGKRKIVIVKEANGYRPVEIETGRERNNATEVLKGLTAGEDVVASGQFLIDSEASLSGVLARLSQQNQPMQKDTGEMTSMQTGIDNKMPDKTTDKTPTEKMPQGRGEVMDIDVKAGKVTLHHEPIAEIGWPAMTMGFKVKDRSQLAKLKIGDQVEFDLKADDPDQYMIERIEKSAAMKASVNGAKP